jgi:Phosphotransferase enzyme family
MDLPDTRIVSRVNRIVGHKLISWTPKAGGYTPALRWAAANRSISVFVKCGVTPTTASMLRKEIVAYEQIHAKFMPVLVGSDDDGDIPILVIEDLSRAHWPPPWTENSIAQVIEAVAEMHEMSVPLPLYASAHTGRGLGWREVAANPDPFLSLGIASAGWLNAALPILTRAEAACNPNGDALTHWDLRSDNICITQQGVKFIDWPEACLSNPKLDLGFWLPSLAHEGGPMPQVVLGDEPAIAAWVSGFFAARAGLPMIADAPCVRRVQREQLSTALPWAAHALGVPTPT